MTTTVLSAPEINCGACQSAIENAVSPADGVRSVEVDIAAKTVTVGYDDAVVSTQALAGLVEEQGYDVEAMREDGGGTR